MKVRNLGEYAKHREEWKKYVVMTMGLKDKETKLLEVYRYIFISIY